MSNLKKWIVALLAVLMLFSVGMTQQAFAIDIEHDVMYANDPNLLDSDYDGIPDAYDTAPDSNVFTGRLKSGHDGTTTISYTMDYRAFFGENTVYSPDLGTVSVMGAALAYYAADYSNAYFTFDVPQTWEGGTASRVNGVELMQVLGFEDVVDFSLDTVYNDDDLCEAIFGHRTVTYNGETKVIVAIWVRGTDSKSVEEWSSNFHMGDLVRFFDQYDSVAGKSPRQSNSDWTRKTNHRGFDVCATRLLSYLKDYYFDPYVQPALDAAADATLAYWLTGHSRGAAVANLMATYLIDEDNQVFAYTFAAPYNTANTEASAEKYDCIFNLVNSNDFIPMMPMPEWGFTRYGKTASVDASAYSSQIATATGETYSGKYLTASEMSTLLGKFICITGENADRNNPGKILGWREVYVFHCGHTHEGETVGNYQSTTFREKGGGFLGIGALTESDYNGYATRMRKYSYWNGGICQTPAYDLQVLVELLVQVAQGNALSGSLNYITSNKLAEKFDFDKQSLISYANKLTEPHFMDTYSVIQAQINSAGDPGARFHTLPYYTANGAAGGRPAHAHTYTYVAYEGHEPTCTAPGLGYRFCVCSGTNADYYDDYQKNVVIPALGHTPGEPVIENEVAATCTEAGSYDEVVYCTVCHEEVSRETKTIPATGHTPGEPVIENEVAAICTEAGSYDEVIYCTVCHKELSRETKTIPATGHNPGEAVIENEVAATCETDGSYDEVIYCTVCREELSRETKTIPATGHDWDAPTYEWAEDNSSVTATRVCGNNESHFETETAETTAVTTEASCTEPGTTTYTAVFENEAFETQQKILTNEEALGHAWGEVSYTWAEDNSEVTATRICANDPSHIESETVSTSYADATPASCEADGLRVYTAAFENPAFEPQTREVTIPATGHAWGEPIWNWNDTVSATASFVCGNDESHTVTLDAVISEEVIPADCEVDGKTIYTAAVTLDGVEYTDSQEVRIPATGHRYSEPEYMWIQEEGSFTVIATVTCQKNPDHEISETATATYEVLTEPTETENGLGRYTAVFQSEFFTTQFKDVVLPKFGPDGYHIYVTDYTKGKANISLDAEALYEGEVSFTVNCDKVCKVGLVNDDGTITKLVCTTTDDTHSFTVTVTDADVNLVVVINGDFNLDGSMKKTDATLIKKLLVELIELDESTAAVQTFAGDVNDDGNLKQADATVISKVLVELVSLSW